MSANAQRYRRRRPSCIPLDDTQTTSDPSGDDLTPFEIALLWLRADGVEITLEIDHASLACLVAEAVNAAAKCISYDYYRIKAECVDYAADLLGVTSGWGDDGAFYLSTPTVGVISFHDPNGEINSAGSWPHPWSGWRRQDFVFDLLAGDGELLDLLAWLTSPLAVG